MADPISMVGLGASALSGITGAMGAKTNAANVPRINRFAEDKEVSEGTRIAQYSLLDEIPGLIFGLMTVVYIVSSLCSLA